ncbi:hypothetical protein [Thermococcus sp. AM4]|uniref:hypothetical protein n=1 Tax=Thermococcus sp. (strain AM4) TaxID=246969 RepID=UPI0001870F7F|nr:hypothetical protein [Thermococcus sp. AM4]
MGVWRIISIIVDIILLIFMLMIGLYIIFTLIDWFGVKGTIVTILFLLLIMAAASGSTNTYEYEHTSQIQFNENNEIKEEYENLVRDIQHRLTITNRVFTTDIPLDILEDLEFEGYLKRDHSGGYVLVRDDIFLDSAIKRSVKKYLAKKYPLKDIDEIVDELEYGDL